MPLLDTVIGQLTNGAAGVDESLNKHYSPVSSNWYKSLPYAFKAVIDGKQQVFNLPIAPQNLNITTYYATNTIATLYGTVEEHSEQRYFDIAISGTTGFAPRYVTSADAQAELSGATSVNPLTPAPHGNGGRLSYASSAIFANLAGGFFAGTLNKLDQAANKASDALNTALGKAKPFQPGVFFDNSGYAAFHNLYRFFLEYKRSAASGKAVEGAGASGAIGSLASSFGGTGNAPTSQFVTDPSKAPLMFINYKDNNQYACTIQRFVLERNAENPMFYNYTIQLRAYNIQPITNKVAAQSFEDRINELGLNTGPSLISKIKLTIRNAKGAINSVGGAFTTLGA